MNIEGNERILTAWALFSMFVFLLMFIDGKILPLLGW